jgi:hypothetical protein
VFAIIAALLFLLALLDVTIGSVNLVTAGLLFVALHLCLAIPLAFPRRNG